MLKWIVRVEGMRAGHCTTTVTIDMIITMIHFMFIIVSKMFVFFTADRIADRRRGPELEGSQPASHFGKLWSR